MSERVMDTNAKDRTLGLREYTQNRCKILDSQMKECQTYLNGISRFDEQALPGVQEEKNWCLNRLEPLVQEHRVLKRSAKGLIDDMSDDIKVIRRRKSVATATDDDMLAIAYTNTLHQRFCGAAKQKKMNFDKSKFRKAVVEYYDAEQQVEGGELVCCHLLGQLTKSEVNAAHIIPKSLEDDMIGHLLGSEERNSRASPKNALSLHHIIEEAMHKGQVAIVPIPAKENEPTR